MAQSNDIAIDLGTSNVVIYMKGRKLLVWVLRVAVGAVFCLSALAKLAGIDQFELYIYSYGFFPLNACFIAAILCIGMELAMGLLTLTGWFPRTMRVATIGILLFFTLFLCYAALAGRTDSCQCFGGWAEMSPVQSILKNAVLLVVVLELYRVDRRKRVERKRWKGIVAAVLVLASVTTPFIGAFAPDNWLFGAADEPYNEAVLQEALSEGSVMRERGLGEGHRLVAFVTKGCPYCKMTREKLNSMARRHGLEEWKIVYVEPSDVGKETFIGITYGARPLVMLLDGSRVVRTYHMRNINERELVDFLSENDEH